MSKEISRRPMIGIVGCENRQNNCIGSAIGRIVARREAILVFSFSRNEYSSVIPMEAAFGARMAGGETLGITTNSNFICQDMRESATWVLSTDRRYETYEYRTMLAWCDALITTGLNLAGLRYFSRKAAGRIPLIEIARSRLRASEGPSLMQVVENESVAVDTAIAQIIAGRKGA